jgi:hypothetical protein
VWTSCDFLPISTLLLKSINAHPNTEKWFMRSIILIRFLTGYCYKVNVWNKWRYRNKNNLQFVPIQFYFIRRNTKVISRYRTRSLHVRCPVFINWIRSCIKCKILLTLCDTSQWHKAITSFCNSIIHCAFTSYHLVKRVVSGACRVAAIHRYIF